MKKYFLILGMALLTGSFIYAGVDNPNKTTETSVQSSGDKVKLYYKSTEINPVKVAIFRPVCNDTILQFLIVIKIKLLSELANFPAL